MDLIIFAHPGNKGSHNVELLNQVREKLAQKKKSHELIDLYTENFDPVLRYDKSDPNVEKYQKMISKAERLIFIYPIWWYTTPAILKGFLDKVLTVGFAFNYTPEGKVKGHLTSKKAIVINTFGGPKEEIQMAQDAMASTFHKGVLGYCGIELVGRLNWFNARKPEERLPADLSKELDSIL